MGHYAKVENGVVTQVIVAQQDFISTLSDASSWVKTSYNTRGGVHYVPDSDTPSADQTKALRKNFAGIGFTYDSEKDAFIPPKPYPSWVLDENTCLWGAPQPEPALDESDVRGVLYVYWDEEAYDNGNGNGWVQEPIS